MSIAVFHHPLLRDGISLALHRAGASTREDALSMSYAYERVVLPTKPGLRTLREPKVINFDLVMIMASELSYISGTGYL